jgi:hypothetical protein
MSKEKKKATKKPGKSSKIPHCLDCGRVGHTSSACTATIDVKGRPIEMRDEPSSSDASADD